MIPAPIDEKNVTTDWLEYIFDFADFVCNGDVLLGFVGGKPVMATVDYNTVTWQFINDGDTSELKTRLLGHDDDNDDLLCRYEEGEGRIKQSFFFSEDGESGYSCKHYDVSYYFNGNPVDED